jgi:hypothetical protein
MSAEGRQSRSGASSNRSHTNKKQRANDGFCGGVLSGTLFPLYGAAKYLEYFETVQLKVRRRRSHACRSRHHRSSALR